MKILNKISWFCITYFFTLLSCNNDVSNPINKNNLLLTSQNAKEKAVLDTIQEECDYYVDFQNADDMIKKFKADFRKEGTANPILNLTDKFWIDACVFRSLDAYFTANGKGFDGVRFYNIGKLKSQIMIVLTSEVQSPSSTDQHTDRYNDIIPLEAGCVSFRNINLGSFISKNNYNDFGEKYRKEVRTGDRSSAPISHDALSLGVWMAKCKINAIAKILVDNSDNVNGMIIYPAAYKNLIDNPNRIGQKYPVQSTLIFVPGKNINSPAWELVTPPPNLIKEVKSGGFNHGQLCPQICD